MLLKTLFKNKNRHKIPAGPPGAWLQRAVREAVAVAALPQHVEGEAERGAGGEGSVGGAKPHSTCPPNQPPMAGRGQNFPPQKRSPALQAIKVGKHSQNC